MGARKVTLPIPSVMTMGCDSRGCSADGGASTAGTGCVTFWCVDSSPRVGHFSGISTLAEIEQAADALSPEEVRLLMAHLAEKVAQHEGKPLQKRVAGLHAGQWVLA